MLSGSPWAAYLPNGSPDRATYYLGLLVLAEAFAAPADYGDLLDAYEALIAETKGGTLLETHKDLLCRAADEIYYAARYQGLPVDARMIDWRHWRYTTSPRSARQASVAVSCRTRRRCSMMRRNCAPIARAHCCAGGVTAQSEATLPGACHADTQRPRPLCRAAGAVDP